MKNNLSTVLAIESSCDETAVAIYNFKHGLLSHSLYSQIKLHREYGGVVPELASRDHLTKISPLIDECLNQADLELKNIDAFAYTQGPGLAGALLIGASLSNTLAFTHNKPVIGIHHLEGHILSPFLSEKKPKFPFMCLLVSGGHTQIIWVESIGKYELLGETLDDSAGEAFDKTAKLLGMDYPGGPIVSEYAIKGKDIYNFPRPMKNSDNLDFSFAGLKTAVLTQVNKIQINEETKQNICASFVNATVDVLVHKCIKAIKQKNISNIDLVICGGVSANLQLRQSLEDASKKYKFNIYYPPMQWCTDNAAMIALTACYKLQDNPDLATFEYNFKIKPRWNLV